MGIFYLIRELMGQKDINARRNVRIFVFGIFIYIVLYIILQNLRLKKYFFADSLMSGLVLLFISDLCVMGYLYRHYYGRNIFSEMDPDDVNKKYWKYNDKTHKYERKTDVEIEIEAQQERIRHQPELDRLAKERAKMAAIEREHQEKEKIQEKTKEIIMNKEQVRAAQHIQAWWRHHLYAPVTGKWYLDAKRDFTINTQI